MNHCAEKLKTNQDQSWNAAEAFGLGQFPKQLKTVESQGLFEDPTRAQHEKIRPYLPFTW